MTLLYLSILSKLFVFKGGLLTTTWAFNKTYKHFQTLPSYLGIPEEEKKQEKKLKIMGFFFSGHFQKAYYRFRPKLMFFSNPLQNEKFKK